MPAGESPPCFPVFFVKYQFSAIHLGWSKIQKVGFLISWQHFPITLCVRSHQKKFQLSTINISSPPGTLKNCRAPFIRPEKKFFKVCLVGTLNLCLKVPKKMQKTRNQSDHPRLRKRPKTVKNRRHLNWVDFWQFLDVFSVWHDRIDF